MLQPVDLPVTSERLYCRVRPSAPTTRRDPLRTIMAFLLVSAIWAVVLYVALTAV